MVTGSLVLYNSDINIYKKTVLSFLESDSSCVLVVVDNSKVNIQERILHEHFDVFFRNNRIIYCNLPQNPGYGAAHNYGFNLLPVMGEYHIILNPDISFGYGVIDSLVQYADCQKNVALVMPKVIYPNGELQYLCKLLPTPFDLFVRRFLPMKSFQEKWSYRYELRASGYSKIMNVPYLSGCFMFLRSEVFKLIGGFDERFFMYPEDIDLTRRIHENYKTIYYPFVSVIHAHEKASYKSLKMLWIHVSNMCRYFNKWGWFFDLKRKKYNKQILKELMIE